MEEDEYCNEIIECYKTLLYARNETQGFIAKQEDDGDIDLERGNEDDIEDEIIECYRSQTYERYEGIEVNLVDSYSQERLDLEMGEAEALVIEKDQSSDKEFLRAKFSFEFLSVFLIAVASIFKSFFEFKAKRRILPLCLSSSFVKIPVQGSGLTKSSLAI